MVAYALEKPDGEILASGTLPALYAFDYYLSYERDNIIRSIPFAEDKKD